MKVYYSGTNILDVWCLWLKGEDPNLPYSVLELDEEWNRQLAALLLANNRQGVGLPDRFSLNASGQLVSNDTQQVVTINPNPEKEAWKLSQLHGMSQAQLETYIDQQFAAVTGGRNVAQMKAYIDAQMATITNINTAKAVIGPLFKTVVDLASELAEMEKKMAALELWLVKQSGLE